MTVAEDDRLIDPMRERFAFDYEPDRLALLVAAGMGLVAGVLIAVATALALALGSAAVAVGLVAAVAFVITTVGVFEAGRRTAVPE